MTTETKDLPALIASVAEKVGVPVPKHVDFEHWFIYDDDREHLKPGYESVVSEPAVQAAVIAWTHEVIAKFCLDRRDAMSAYIESYDPGLWVWHVVGAESPCEEGSHIDASVAVLRAIDEEVNND
jgi:hypothetical protein